MWNGEDLSTMSAKVYTLIRRRIISGDLRMGEVISRRRVAADLSTSACTVTAALLRLECEGLLEHRPRVGTRVPIPSVDDVRGQYVVLEALGVHAATRFAECATRRAWSGVEKLAKRVDQLAIQGDRRTFAAEHRRLHLRIAAGNAGLRQAFDRTYALAGVWLVGLQHGPPFDAPMRHMELVTTLVSGDAAAAAQAVREHLADELERVLQLVADYDRRRMAGRRISYEIDRPAFRPKPRNGQRNL